MMQVTPCVFLHSHGTDMAKPYRFLIDSRTI